MLLLEGLRWALREGGYKILEALRTRRMGSPVEEQPQPNRDGQTDTWVRRRGVDVRGLRRRFLSKLWRH